MSLKIVVLAKQVPDTRNVGKDAMTAEGTVNRAALPAIFNPEDLNALEQALRLKEQNPGSTVGILTMGPPRAGEIIRQGLYRGADTGWLLTDRLFAGADTLATSYALATGIQKIGDVDIVIGGRQAIDGDTAQVGPQVAQKLGLNQVTYAEEILKVEDGKATIRRLIDGGVETVEAPLPLVITVNGSAAPCRPCNVKLVMKYKYATCPMERKGDEPWANLYEERPYLALNQWSVADVDGDPAQCGLSGSPTKVKAVKNIVFQAKESKTLTSSVGCFQSEVSSKKSETDHQKNQVDDQVDYRGSKGKKFCKNNSHSGYSAERKIIWKFKNIDADIHNEYGNGNNKVFF